ncbi:MAG: GAF domain-containing protein [Alphaproteobacteria bacterium]|nr:GAF domain-containing protein [Alphaproteobacteria bacterium]
MRELALAEEAKRLQALATYRTLDTPPEFAYDALTELAAEICRCPVALISLVDERRQWFKAKYGLPAEFIECPCEVSVCSAAVCGNDLIYAPDLTLDNRFKDLPLVTGEPHLKFYCGMPLINRDGFAIGTLCVVDFSPHDLTPAQREVLRRLAQQAIAQLELRRSLMERDDLVTELAEAKHAAERARSDTLLHSVMPAPVADELKATGRMGSRYHEAATILIADFREFTRLTEGLEPARLVDQLNQQFTKFDEISATNRVEMLKTMGDACLCVAGLTEATKTHALDACLAGLQFQKPMAESNKVRSMLRMKPWELRIGINTGPLVAGVVGTRRFTYDVWGQRRERGAAAGAGLRAGHAQHLGQHVPSRGIAVRDRGARLNRDQAPRRHRHVRGAADQAGVRGRCRRHPARRRVLGLAGTWS